MLIDINQDYEYDEVFGLGAAMNVFWAPGHGYEDRDFIRAVVAHSLDEHDVVPYIGEEAEINEMYQSVQEQGDGSLVYDRRPMIPEYDHFRGPVDWKPVTVMDLDRRHPGARKCAVRGCSEPWSAGLPVQVLIAPTDGADVRCTADLWLCRTHTKEIPDPVYRLAFIPVGAEVVLDSGST